MTVTWWPAECSSAPSGPVAQTIRWHHSASSRGSQTSLGLELDSGRIFIQNILHWIGQRAYNAPVGVNLLNWHRVEHNADHELGEDGAVLDEPLIVCGWLFPHHGNNPLQDFLLQLQIFLKINWNKTRKENCCSQCFMLENTCFKCAWIVFRLSTFCSAYNWSNSLFCMVGSGGGLRQFLVLNFGI